MARGRKPNKPKVEEPITTTTAAEKPAEVITEVVTQEEPEEQGLWPHVVDYWPRMWPHVTCPRCNAGEPRIYKTRNYTRASLRYHRCYCGTKFKSMETW